MGLGDLNIEQDFELQADKIGHQLFQFSHDTALRQLSIYFYLLQCGIAHFNYCISL